MTSALLEEFEPEELAKMTDAEKQALYLKRTTVRNDESQDGEIELPVKKATSKRTRAQINKQLRRQAQEAEETRARKQKKLDKSIGEVSFEPRHVQPALHGCMAETDALQTYGSDSFSSLMPMFKCCCSRIELL